VVAWWLIGFACALGALSFNLLLKMKHATNKKDGFWHVVFIILASVLLYSTISAIILLFSLISDLQSLSFLLTAFLLAFAVIVSVASTYQLVERVKYSEAHELQKKNISETSLLGGTTYIVEEMKSAQSLALFTKQSAGHGLAIIRNNPKQYSLPDAKVHWLTEVEGDGNLHPTDLEEISYTINNYINNTKEAVVFVEGLEYLVNYNSFTKILHLFQVLKDNISLKQAILILPINPKTFEPQNLKLLEAEFTVV
jgi:membrane protein implicated in regulation of membrane protease activity